MLEVQSLLALSLFTSSLCIVEGQDAGAINFACPRSEGQFPFPADCHKYYVCKNKKAKLEICPENQGFQEIWNQCIWEGYVESCSRSDGKKAFCGINDDTDHTDPRKFTPWVVGVFQRNHDDKDWEFISPGVIVGPTTVMTTCRLGRMINGKWRASANASAFHVLAAAESLDESNQDEFSQILQVSYIKVNPKNTGKSYEFCNSLLHLKTPITFTSPFAKPICVPFFKSSSKNKNLSSFGFRGSGILSNYAERSTASDGFAHMNSIGFRLTSHEYCFAHTFQKTSYCGVSQSGGNLVDTCMAHSTVSAAKISPDPRWFLLGFGSNFNGGVCAFRSLDDDSKLQWITNGIRCGPSKFPCDSGKCIDLSLVCNNDVDCPNGEDEDVKWCRARNPCINDATFECGVYENCIEPKKVCDGFPDCYDASDEDPNTCKNVKRKNTVPFYASMLSESSTSATEGDSKEFAEEVTVPEATSPSQPQPTSTVPVEDSSEVSDSDSIRSHDVNKPKNPEYNRRPDITGLPTPTESEIQPRNNYSNNPKRNCPPLGVDQGTILKCTNPAGQVIQDCSRDVDVGTIATYQCKRFYKPGLTSGSSLTKKCFEDFKWKPERYFECVPDCGLVVGSGTSNAYIVDGQTVSTKERFPWHAAIFVKIKNKFEYICGGTLVHQSFVSTAAHCVTDINGDNNKVAGTYQVALAPSTSDFEKLTADKNVQLFQVKKILVNAHYDPSNNFQSDIALLELTKPCVLGIDVMLACLPGQDNADPAPGVMAKVVGFGYDASGKITDVLKFANLPIIKVEDCIAQVHFIPSVNQICAGYKNGTGVCFGDSGGGLVISISRRYYLTGIVSVGPKLDRRRRKRTVHCNHYTYSVFTSVPRFVDWIYDQINLSEIESI